MICDLRSPSSVYCCNRREVVPVWPLRLRGRHAARPHQAPAPAHRSVRASVRPSVRGPRLLVCSVFGKSVYLRVSWKLSLNNVWIHLFFACEKSALCKFVFGRRTESLRAKCGRTRLPPCSRDFAWGWGWGLVALRRAPSPQCLPPTFLCLPLPRSWLPAYLQPRLLDYISAHLTTWTLEPTVPLQLGPVGVVVGHHCICSCR